MILKILQIAGSLGIFLYGMKIMSEGIQKSAGEKLKTALHYMTINRFTAVATGFLITGVVQSSSATTVMLVGLVNAGLFSLKQAIGVIMGANIGTTVTGWIVAVIGFKMNIAAFALPAVAVGIPFIFVTKWDRESFGETLLGFGLLFLGLSLLKDFVPDIKNNPEVLAFLRHYTGLGFLSFIIFIFAGTVLTVAIQSSSAAMAITLTMAYSGWIDLSTAACLVLGENIGTTITAFLASLNTNVTARRAARSHTFFNIIGVIWMAILFQPFLSVITSLIPEIPGDKGTIATQLALFHTLFNLTNTILFLPFVGPFSKLVTRLVKERPNEANLRYKLLYSETSIKQSPEINILKVELEIKKMADLKREMFDLAVEAALNPQKKIHSYTERIREKKALIEIMKDEITQFLIHCSSDNLPAKNLERINSLIRISQEIDNISDSCSKLAAAAATKHDKKIQFDSASADRISAFADVVRKFMEFNHRNLGLRISQEQLAEAEAFEATIDHERDVLKKAAQKRLKNKGSGVKTEMLYIDILRHIEHVGDRSLGIAHALYSMASVPAEIQ